MNRIPAGHEIVNSAELASLRRKAKAHDAYLWATKRMADRVRSASAAVGVGCSGDWSDGYVRALSDFAWLVMEAPQ